jgi:hypothetical protein
MKDATGQLAELARVAFLVETHQLKIGSINSVGRPDKKLERRM